MCIVHLGTKAKFELFEDARRLCKKKSYCSANIKMITELCKSHQQRSEAREP